ncbi:acyl carrier protein [Desulfosporosinus hippei]|uniref:Acyl carrier protein n=1 Tax=Desulfosporosinus hippei DSM 8344 TaxID=1121419 RepID=A0A1G7UDH3_9FIRM|nr:acyl carrier protein [Desulfosporosinus hippei]SDG45524.1 acyl carrier protein [Desulfosporosinus hippei DSM 8344]
MILSRIKIIVDQQFIYEGELNERTRVIDDLGADSLDIPVLVNSIEDEFGITISNEELFKIKTIGDLMNIILDKKQGGLNDGKY